MPAKRKTRGENADSVFDYIRYDNLRHILSIGLSDQDLAYMLVPESVYTRLLLSENRYDLFINEIFNRYPVVITPQRVLRARNRKNAGR